MISYHVAPDKDQAQYLTVTASFPANRDVTELTMPSWRPGRYEAAHFAQYIQKIEFVDDIETPLAWSKYGRNVFKVDSKGAGVVTARYSFFANKLNAGSTYVDDEQLYVNPVNCLLYIPERVEEPCRLSIDVPQGWKVACALPFVKGAVQADSFHQLADSPFIASAKLTHHSFPVEGIVFHIWIMGQTNADLAKIEHDTALYAAEQIRMFGHYPGKEYHFLYQMPAFDYYHGVEHLNSTVICLGPGNLLMSPTQYTKFLGVSSHELFHVWNVKSIRPEEMWPYEYQREQYSPSLYISEGLTTYYGDLMLLRSGVFNLNNYCQEMEGYLNRYYADLGRTNQSLRLASNDAWLDGYTPGIPDRKISFYIKGALVGFILDVHLLKYTSGRHSLDDGMRILYHQFARQGYGFKERDLLDILKDMSGRDYSRFFESYINGTTPIDRVLFQSLESIGLVWNRVQDSSATARKLGFKIKEGSRRVFVQKLAPGSPAQKAGLQLRGEVVHIEGAQVENNLDAVVENHKGDEIRIGYFHNKIYREAVLKKSNVNYFVRNTVTAREGAAELQLHQWWAGKRHWAL